MTVDPSTDDPAWPLIQEWSAEAANPHRLLPAEDAVGIATLDSLEGITEWSVLGGLARHCAALVVDDWLVVLGAGGQGYPGLRELNEPGPDAVPGSLIAAVDVLGGGFVVNGGELGCGEPGEVCYLAPESLGWLPCGMGHSAFVGWTLDGPLDEFYADIRWPGWRDDARALEPGQGFFCLPPLFTTEGREHLTRKPIPLREAWSLTLTYVRRVGPAPSDS